MNIEKSINVSKAELLEAMYKHNNGDMEESEFDVLQEYYVQQETDRRVKLILKKNKKSIAHNKKWAEKCMITGNKDGYIYAIRALRKIYRQPPLSNEQADHMWKTSNAALVNVAKDLIKAA